MALDGHTTLFVGLVSPFSSCLRQKRATGAFVGRCGPKKQETQKREATKTARDEIAKFYVQSTCIEHKIWV